MVGLETEVTNEQCLLAIQLLKALSDNECSFSMERSFDGTCAEDTGRGFSCYKCQARDLIRELDDQPPL